MKGKKKETLIRLRVKPTAPADRIDGFTEDGILTVTVKAPPEKGRANRSVIRLLARRLGLDPSQVVITSGLTSRRKTVRVTGCDADDVQTDLVLEAEKRKRP